MSSLNLGWDRTCLDISSKMTEPFCKSWDLIRYRLSAPMDPRKFENCSTRTQEIALRSLICLGTMIGTLLTWTYPIPVLGSVALLGSASKFLRALGFYLQNGGYTHVHGELKNKTILDSQIKLMTWNICGLAGGFSLDHGGVIHWRARLEGILNTIRTENPDVLILQEAVDTDLAEALIAKLKTEYAHFFIHLGPNVWGVGSGCMVLSKCAIHDFSYTPFTTNEWDLNRGFATLELKKDPKDLAPSIRILGTHLIHGNTAKGHENRVSQVAQMIQSIAKKTFPLPTIITGDLNIERDNLEGKFLASHLRHGYVGSEYTCTNKLISQWDPNASKLPEEMVDYISLVQGTPLPIIEHGVELNDVHIIKAFEEDFNTQTARSDHHALSTKIFFP